MGWFNLTFLASIQPWLEVAWSLLDVAAHGMAVLFIVERVFLPRRPCRNCGR